MKLPHLGQRFSSKVGVRGLPWQPSMIIPITSLDLLAVFYYN